MCFVQIPLRGLKVLVPSAQIDLSRLTKGKVKLYQTGNPERGGISVWLPCTPPKKRKKDRKTSKTLPRQNHHTDPASWVSVKHLWKG